MTLIGIAAVAANRALGRKGLIPWHYSEDFRFFKETTLGSPVVAGLNTWKGLPKLDRRLMVVLSFEPIKDCPKNVINVTQPEQVKALADYCSRPVYIIGGASVYQAFVDLVDHWWITHIPLSPEGCDAFFPENWDKGFAPQKTVRLADGVQAVFYSRTC